MPAKPMSTPAQRRRPTVSRRKTTEKRVTIKGETKKIEVTVASGRLAMAI